MIRSFNTARWTVSPLIAASRPGNTCRQGSSHSVRTASSPANAPGRDGGQGAEKGALGSIHRHVEPDLDLPENVYKIQGVCPQVGIQSGAGLDLVPRGVQAARDNVDQGGQGVGSLWGDVG